MSSPSLLKQIAPAQVASFAYDAVDAAALEAARAIVHDVRDHGVAALMRHAVRLGDVPSEDAPLLIRRAALQQAFETLPRDQQQVLERTVDRVTRFARAQRASIRNFEQPIDGGVAGQDVRSARGWFFFQAVEKPRLGAKWWWWVNG